MICETLKPLPGEKADSPNQNANLPPRVEMENSEADPKAAQKKRAAELALARYNRNRDAILARRRARWAANPEAFRAKQNLQYRKKRERLGFTIEQRRDRKTLTPEMINQKRRECHSRWRNRHREELRKRWRTKAAEKKESARKRGHAAISDLLTKKAKYDKMYRRREIEKRRKWGNEYQDRHKDSQHHVIARRVRGRIRAAIKNCAGKKAYKSMELLGCSIDEARAHLEKTFKPGMTWELFMAGDLEIDHIKPCASFHLADTSQQKLCFNFKNLQMLTWQENNRKGAH